MVVIASAILFAVGLWLGAVAWRWAESSGGLRFRDSATVLRQVQTLSQLVTVKYVMEKVVVLEDVKWFGNGWNDVRLALTKKEGREMKRKQCVDSLFHQFLSIANDMFQIQITDF